MKFEKWHAVAVMIGSLLASGGVTLLSANQVDISKHWIEVVAGVSTLVTVCCTAALAAIAKKKSAP